MSVTTQKETIKGSNIEDLSNGGDIAKEEKKPNLLTNEQKEVMAEENQALVHYVVNNYASTSPVDRSELVSVGMVGYAKALNAYDQNQNVKFSTYAVTCIRNEILFFLRKESRHVKNNTSMNRVLATDKNGNELSLENTLSDLDLNERSLEENFIVSDDVNILREAIKYLPPKEQYVITYRYGLNNGEKKTQREIASHIGMSQANVSKIERNILKKLKQILKRYHHMTDSSYR